MEKCNYFVFTNYVRHSEAAVRRCSSKQAFLKISQYLQDTCIGAYFLIRDSNTGVFLRILRNLREHIFRRTPPDDFFWIYDWEEFIEVIFLDFR